MAEWILLTFDGLHGHPTGKRRKSQTFNFLLCYTNCVAALRVLFSCVLSFLFPLRVLPSFICFSYCLDCGLIIQHGQSVLETAAPSEAIDGSAYTSPQRHTRYPVNNPLLSYHIARTPKRSARATILSVQRISRSSLYPISITSIHDQGNNRRTWSGIRILLRMSSPSTRVLSPSHNYPHLVSVYSVDLAHMCELLVMLRYWSRTVSIQ